MRTIWRFPVELGNNMIPMPEDSEILAFQLQNNAPHIWAIVDDEAPVSNRFFTLTGTGIPLIDDAHISDYIGTVQDGGLFVWHLFERSQR